MNGGNQVGFALKKFVHCVAVTCINVAMVGFVVGGDVVEGNQLAIWSANVLITNVMTELPGTSAETL